jgi:hypothetical protein
MSYYLMVFEKTAAPKNRAEFMKWFEEQTLWAEDHDYNDPKATSNDLRNWFMEIIKTFPQMNGPHAPSDEEIEKMENESYITDYSVGKNIVYAAFAWSLSNEALETVIKLANKHKVGFFDVSAEDGEIIFPD